MTLEAEDARRSAPSTLRNREPILDVLHRELPAQRPGLVVDVGTC